jgi:hypothetical protein
MDAKKMEVALRELVEKKIELSALSYDNASYDDIEEELHELEDDFLDEFGEEMEGVLNAVHEKIKSDSDVLLPIAYIPLRNMDGGHDDHGHVKYAPTETDGVVVESGLYPDKLCRLILLPNPTRIVISVQGKVKETVWQIGA